MISQMSEMVSVDGDNDSDYEFGDMEEDRPGLPSMISDKTKIMGQGL